jgi:hypothetical protein
MPTIAITIKVLLPLILIVYALNFAQFYNPNGISRLFRYYLWRSSVSLRIFFFREIEQAVEISVIYIEFLIQKQIENDRAIS